MALRWDEPNGVGQSIHAYTPGPGDGRLVGAVIRYDRTHWQPIDGVWRIAYGRHYWRGYLRGEPVPGEWDRHQDAIAAVEAHYEASRR